MGLPQAKKYKIYSLNDFSGGLNTTDEPTAINENQVQSCLNAVFGKKGVSRWCGCEAVTAKDGINDFLRGLYNSSEISGTDHLLGMWGGSLYEIIPSTGAISSALITPTGSGEMWGGTHWGKFYGTNGTGSFKVESSTAYRIGIVPPTAGSSSAVAGGTLPNGVYKVKIGYARKVSGLNVLYSQGYDLGDVTLTTGNNAIRITGFSNSDDPQVNNKVVWLTLADGTLYYFFYETDDNISTTITITSDAQYENAITYDEFGSPSGLPPVMSFMGIFDNRIFGIKDDTLYYSLKATVSYDLERFPVLNKIQYPFALTGWFVLGKYLYLNTANDGVLIQAVDDLGSRFEHIEKTTSFKYMRSVVDWNGGKLGLTRDGLEFFDGEKFIKFDYAYNIRTSIHEMYNSADDDFMPCACVVSRNNRMEYHLSFRDTDVGIKNNNRTYVLNLSQTFYQDNLNFKTPWEVIDRGFNYCARSSGGVWYFGQSFKDSSTIYKETAIYTTQSGIYNGVGIYLSSPTNMELSFTGKIFYDSMFTKINIQEGALFFKISEKANISLIIADNPSSLVVHETGITAYAGSNWDEMRWDDDVWAGPNLQRYLMKGKRGVFGYSWYFIFSQTADDPNLLIRTIDVLTILESGNGI